MMKYKNKILICGFIVLHNIICSQDIHISQYYNFPLFCNPANTGDIKGNIRAVAVYRSQWSKIAIPYSTSGFSFESNLYRNRYKTKSLGIGVMLLNDKVGEFKLITNVAILSIAGSVRLNSRNSLALGLQGGFGQKRFDASSLKWGNQYNGLNYDSNISSGEKYYNNLIYNDISAGLNWNFDANPRNKGTYARDANRPKGSLGVALFHINRPNTTLNSSTKLDRIYRKLSVNGSLNITNPTNNVTYIPSFLCEFQGPSIKVNVGSMFRYILKEGTIYTGLKEGKAISFGVFYRHKDAFVLSTLYEYQRTAFGLSYDINISKLVVATQARGGFEFTIRYITPPALRYSKGSKIRKIRAKF
jgi:type IX secretion system PorP/SprF family membrane protein